MDNGEGGTGGGMYNYSSSPTVSNCTFSCNSAWISGGWMFNEFNSNSTVINCILWGDTGGEIVNSSSNPILVYCVVQGGIAISEMAPPFETASPSFPMICVLAN